MNNSDREEQLTLQLLEAVEQDRMLTQRGLATRLGVALGLANSYLKRCARKGLIKIQHIPPNRYTYYLTPAGFSEKANLAVKYFRSSLRFYREAGNQYAQLLESCALQGFRKVVLAGASDLAEIAVLRSMGSGIEIIGVYDPFFPGDKFLGYEVLGGEFADVSSETAVVMTSLENLGEIYRRVLKGVDERRVRVPRLLESVLGAHADAPSSERDFN